MRSRMSTMRKLLWLITATLAPACGGVSAIDVHDERLPLEARLWVGGAEDAVAIARAAVTDARTNVRAIDAWVDDLPGKRDVSGGSSDLVEPLHTMAEARLELYERRLDKAEADLQLARVRRDLVYAETSMRYDLGVYDLKAMRAERDDAQKELEERSAEADKALVAHDKASEAFWSAYRAKGGPSVDDALMWLVATGGR